MNTGTCRNSLRVEEFYSPLYGTGTLIRFHKKPTNNIDSLLQDWLRCFHLLFGHNDDTRSSKVLGSTVDSIVGIDGIISSPVHLQEEVKS